MAYDSPQFFQTGAVPQDVGLRFEVRARVLLEVTGDLLARALDARDERLARAFASITCDPDGERMQESRTSNLIFTVPELVSYLSRHCALEPGDLIFTGTPAGVGPVVKGDLMGASIEGMGGIAVRVV